jgi:hypothetical protein
MCDAHFEKDLNQPNPLQRENVDCFPRYSNLHDIGPKFDKVVLERKAFCK